MSDEKKATAVAVASKASPLFALGKRFAIEPSKLVEVLRGTVIKPTKEGRHATNEEVAAFCMVANQYGLNPFTREIHAFADPKKGVVPIVGIDGWTHIVNAQPGFDGVEFEEESDDKGKPLSITCTIFVKGRNHPVRVTERFSECFRPTGPWNTMPFRMLRHKAFMQTARYAFSLSGIYDDDEARDIVYGSPAVMDADVDLLPPAKPEPGQSRLGAELKRKAKKAEVVVEPEAAPAGDGKAADAEPDAERDELISRLLPLENGFPKRFRSTAVDIGLDPDEWRTAPVDGLQKLLANIEAEV